TRSLEAYYARSGVPVPLEIKLEFPLVVQPFGFPDVFVIVNAYSVIQVNGDRSRLLVNADVDRHACVELHVAVSAEVERKVKHKVVISIDAVDEDSGIQALFIWELRHNVVHER